MNNPYAFTEFFKNSFDFNQVFATHRRNIEALSAANQAIVEGAQVIARRNAEALREGVEGALKCSRELLTAGTPENTMNKQAELTRQVFQSSMENTREVTETLTKSLFEAFELLQKRATESFDEFSKAAGNAPASKKKAA